MGSCGTPKFSEQMEINFLPITLLMPVIFLLLFVSFSLSSGFHLEKKRTLLWPQGKKIGCQKGKNAFFFLLVGYQVDKTVLSYGELCTTKNRKD